MFINPGRSSLNRSAREIAHLGCTSPCSISPLTCQSLKHLFFAINISSQATVDSYKSLLQSSRFKAITEVAFNDSPGAVFSSFSA